MSYIEELNTKNNMIDEYFLIYNKYKKIYGINTIFFIQVGSFYEAYQTLTDGYNLKKISDILNIILSRRNKSILEINNKNPYIMGYPLIAHTKYLKILLENNFIVIIADQISPPPNPRRAVTNIYTKTTYIDDINNQDTNNILSIYIEELDKYNLIVGLSVLDISTGYSNIYENYSIKDDEKICLDDTIRYMYVHNAKEIVITTNNLVHYKLNELITYLEISDKNYHHQTITHIISVRPLFKISYQQEILRKVFPDHGLLSPIEYLDLEKYIYGRLSYIILLNYAYDHSHNIINNISKPEIYSDNKYLILGNNAIFQLNLLTFDKDNMIGMYNENTQYKSLFDVLNKVSTPMGRRLLKENICQPLTNVEDIQERYDIINKMMNIYIEIDQKLIEINDIEKMSRKIYLNIINPLELYNLINSLSKAEELLNYIIEQKIVFKKINIKEILMCLVDMLKDCSHCFKIDDLQKYFINDINGMIFKNKIHPDIDQLNINIILCMNYIDALAYGISTFLDNELKTNNVNLVKVEYNDRDKYHLILTKRRSEVLEKLLDKNNIIKFTYKNNEYVLHKTELEFRYLPKGNNCKIFIKEIDKNSNKLLEYQDELKLLQKKYYIEFLVYITKSYKINIDKINKTIALIDLFKCACICIKKYHYSIPVIIDKYKSNSYLSATELRHPLIELLHKDKEYITNNISLGTDDTTGIILYGMNGSGKSSLMKSIAIAVIMAQIGFGVACKNFEFYPYKNLYTRISGNDNIYKQLSTFALEMIELKAILKRSHSNTLVVCDELSKGTNHKSAIIIVASMIKILSDNNTSFITATHLHEINNINSIKLLNNIKTYYLNVEYNSKENIIIYDRIMKLGCINNDFYGLDVAKNLLSNNVFFNIACDFKKEIFCNDNIIEPKTSNYNNDLYMSECQICNYKPNINEIPLETHHIIFQKDFKNNINYDKYHISNKNNKYNLICICNKCHVLLHNKKIFICGWKDCNLKNKLIWNNNIMN